jgi:hypothetical protein
MKTTTADDDDDDNNSISHTLTLTYELNSTIFQPVVILCIRRNFVLSQARVFLPRISVMSSVKLSYL